MAVKGSDPTLKIRELRSTLAEVLQQVENGQRVLVEKYYTPVAAIVPISDYLALRRLDASRTQTQLTKEKHMAHRIVVTNISGGEGKTSVTRELAFALLEQGYKVALMDTDPQASLTKSLGLHDEEGGLGRDEMPGFQEKHTVLGAFQKESGEGRLGPPIQLMDLDIWVSNDHLYGADTLIASDLSRLGNLREALDEVSDQYDFVLIDTKPGITPLLNASVAAADHLIVPISGDKGTENLDKIVRLIKAARGFAPRIGVRMFVPNRVRGNTRVYKELLELMQSYKTVAPLSSQIRDSVIVMEAARARKSVLKYRPGSEVAQDIRNVAQDLLMLLGVVAAESATGGQS
ncbi:type II toxin-antitoxin system prevent-host-death family antitoxin [Deinococcus alpinitundrae]|uniref:type II toxin-antitoxin system prevent-host-death family antitoxin n=1 Tax=Deinococcus alpinitundrae TaxID=468913 RepID=UPI00137A5109|nr:type II toxin-antitoxin system prevent-host-death family antitoxin [Deinococcus alpinitundrae]